MKRIAGWCFVIAVFSLFQGSAGFAQSNVSESGRAGLSFLTIVPCARQAASGLGGSAHYYGPSSMWANPALLAYQKTRSADISHMSWIEGITHEYAAFATPFSAGVLGINAQIFDSGDIDARSAAGSDLGSYSITNAAIGVAYAMRPVEWLAVGVKYKSIFQKIGEESATGFAVDAGVTVDTPVPGLRMGAAARNYGSMGELRNEKVDLPSSVMLGGEYSRILPMTGREASISADVLFKRFGDDGIRLGTAVDASDYLAVLLGYRSDSDFESMIYGIELTWQIFNASFSYSPLSGVSDDALRFTLSVTEF